MDPVTVPQAGGHSAMSMITFKSWDVRSSFLRRFGGQSGTPLYHTAEQPVAGRHVKVSPCAPQWQRKLEAPLRVVLSAVNAHEELAGNDPDNPLEEPHRYENPARKGILSPTTPPGQGCFMKKRGCVPR